MATGILMLVAGRSFAQDWSYISEQDILSKDSVTRGEYTLIFINKDSAMDKGLQQRMTDAFFTVYPKQAKLYNPATIKKVIFIMDPGYKGVAATAAGIVRYNPEYMHKHPKDIDVVTHEVMHLVQSYPGGAGPGWVTEGIADYVRFKMGVDNAGDGWKLPEFNASQHYTNSYRVTARFLVWIEKQYDKKFVKGLDNALRTHTYTENYWKAKTGKTVNELWQEYALNPVI
ncbi:hypothetical protein FLA_6052 [Filimonas lacunae]|nr:hypothetical protein FLA_6052 [Filimonas lacunae]